MTCTFQGNIADLTVTDTPHKEGQTQKVIAEETGCSQGEQPVSNILMGSLVEEKSATEKTDACGFSVSFQLLSCFLHLFPPH